MFRFILFLILVFVSTSFSAPDWGFYGHRTINRKAVFTLPPPLISFYKNNIEFITEHAVDPDKRRYATKHEAVRHYIDVDHWGTFPFDNVPRLWHEVILKYARFIHAGTENDTFQINCWDAMPYEHPSMIVDCDTLYQLFYEVIQPIYYEDEKIIDLNLLNQFLDRPIEQKGNAEIQFDDTFSEYGILPYHLEQYYQKLVNAFSSKDINVILRLSAEIGHYIGDAHVPLHTTENYNGQLSDQVGIHGFWESRLPELFAEESYDFFVGKALYIEDTKSYFWDVVLTSHSHLEEVLAFEKSLSKSFPQDQQYCFEERLERTIQTQCEPYAIEYHKMLDGMVETRMRDAVLSIGSIWHSAWVDAGQPDLDIDGRISFSEEDKEAQKKLNLKFKSGDIKGRSHDQ